MKNASTLAVRPAVTRSFAIGLITAATVALGPFGRAAADATDNFPIPTG
jgi:lipid-binding SYLF domain-containing protein